MKHTNVDWFLIPACSALLLELCTLWAFCWTLNASADRVYELKLRKQGISFFFAAFVLNKCYDTSRPPCPAVENLQAAVDMLLEWYSIVLEASWIIPPPHATLSEYLVLGRNSLMRGLGPSYRLAPKHHWRRNIP